MARTKNKAAPPAAIKSSDAIPSSNARWNLTASGVGFGVILIALAAVAIVGMRVSWVPLRDTADTIGLHEVRQFYPLVIDLLAGLAVVASIALYGSSGYRWAIGTVVGLTAISLMLNVAHGSAAARIDASSDWPTWGHVILASAAPVICIGLGTHLAALTWGRVAAAHRALRGSATPATPRVAAAAASSFRWADAVPAGVRLLPLMGGGGAPATQGVAAPLPRRGELLTTDEIAERCNVKPGTVRSWVLRAKLTPVATDPDDHSNLFDARDVERLRGTA